MKQLIVEIETLPDAASEIAKAIRQYAPQSQVLEIETQNIIELRESAGEYIPPVIATILQIVGWSVDSKALWDYIKTYLGAKMISRGKVRPSQVRIKLGPHEQELNIETTDTEMILEVIKEFNKMRQTIDRE